ncbi:MAG: hypothetical protein SOX54_01950 [Prevotella sp.]|nr:hypothetical protein [Prevotella sp.]
MRKQLLNLKFLLMLCMIFCIGGGNVALAEDQTLTIDFESATTVYSDWTFTNMTSKQTGTITAHAGTYYGTTGGKETASISTNSLIANPKSITFYVSKQSNNTTASTWKLQTSSDNSTWTDVKTQSATSMSKGTWVEVTQDLSAYSNVYIRIYYKGTTAVRNIDDVKLTYSTGSTTTVTFGLEVDNQTFDVNLGEKFVGKTATVSPTEAGSVTYSSDNTEVATVNENTGAITIGNTAGKATITASFAATDTYLASSAKYYISVIDPNGPVFYESFNDNEGLGGNDGKWSGFSATSTLQYDKSRWNVENGSGASRCVKIGTGDAKGSATTPAIDLSGDKYILTFKAGAWNAKDEKTAIDVVISDGKLTYNGTTSKTQTIEMNKAKWTDYTMTIAGATNSTTITFTAKVKSDNRFFLDEVKIVKPVTSTLSLVAEDNGIYYATFSSSEAVIFPSSDVEVDAVSVKGSTLNIAELAKDDYLVKATNAEGFDVVSNGYYVPANTGVLIQSLENSVTYYYPYEAATVNLPTNQLKAAPAKGGEFTPEPGDHLYYKLAYNDFSEKEGLGFYWGAENGGAFSVKAGTAYLAVPSTSGTANVKGFSFDGASTGVSALVAEEPAKTRVIYNIAGQKVNAMTKAGLYIVNGKKIVIRK